MYSYPHFCFAVTYSFFVCRPDGKVLWVPPRNIHFPSLSLLAKGDIVTFSYEYHSKSAAPVNPIIYKVRTDITWEDVVSNFLRDNPSPQYPGIPLSLLYVVSIPHFVFLTNANYLSPFLFLSIFFFLSFSAQRHGYWTTGKGKDMRRVFERIALHKNLDPLLASSWYIISHKDVEKIKVRRTK